MDRPSCEMLATGKQWRCHLVVGGSVVNSHQCGEMLTLYCVISGGGEAESRPREPRLILSAMMLA